MPHARAAFERPARGGGGAEGNNLTDKAVMCRTVWIVLLLLIALPSPGEA